MERVKVTGERDEGWVYVVLNMEHQFCEKDDDLLGDETNERLGVFGRSRGRAVCQGYLKGKGHEKLHVVGPGWVEKQRTWFARRLRVVGGQAVTKVVPFEDSEEDISDKESREERRMRGEEANSQRGEPEIEESLVPTGEMELVEDEYMEGRKGEFKISADEIGYVESGEAYDFMMGYWIDIMELELDSEHFSAETVWTYIQDHGERTGTKM